MIEKIIDSMASFLPKAIIDDFNKPLKKVSSRSDTVRPLPYPPIFLQNH